MAEWNGIYSCAWVYLHLYGFVPCLVMTCRAVWKDVWPSDAVLVTKLPLGLSVKCD